MKCGGRLDHPGSNDRPWSRSHVCPWANRAAGEYKALGHPHAARIGGCRSPPYSWMSAASCSPAAGIIIPAEGRQSTSTYRARRCARLKVRYGLKIAVVSNESRGVNAYRIRKFKLDGFVNCLISSCFVHMRKPDADIFRLALDIAQAPARHVLYIENTPMFVQIAEGLGIRSILHTDYKSNCAKPASFGLQDRDDKD